MLRRTGIRALSSGRKDRADESMTRRAGRIRSFPAALPDVRWTGLILIGLMILFLALPSAGEISPENAGIEWGPWITNTTSGSATIHWKTAEPVTGSVEFSRFDNGTPEEPYRTETERTAGVFHQVTLEGLAPGTAYAYRPAGSPVFFHFRTFPGKGPVRFIVYGDTRGQEGWKNQEVLRRSVADAIAREDGILFVVHTGDLVYDSGNLTDWERFFDESGEFLANTTFFPVAGNHESNLTMYGGIFSVPAWYSFSCDGARVIVLDTNPMSTPEERVQEEWLEQELEDSPEWTFVALHRPLYSSEESHYGGNPDLRDAFEALFIRTGVDAVFSAHVHAYEHYERGGVNYFTVGTGGAPFYPLSMEKPEGHVASIENTVGYAVVTVDEDRSTVDFIRVAEEQEGVVDLFPPGSVAERVILAKSSPVILPGLHVPSGQGDFPEIRIPFLPR
jgi:3',5'-cyclic AMP phosphodiesterase CpdA